MREELIAPSDYFTMKRVLILLFLASFAMKGSAVSPLWSSEDAITAWSKTAAEYSSIRIADASERKFKFVSRGFYSSRSVTEVAIFTGGPVDWRLCIYLPKRDGFFFPRLNQHGALEITSGSGEGSAPEIFFTYLDVSEFVAIGQSWTPPPDFAQLDQVESWSGDHGVLSVDFSGQAVYVVIRSGFSSSAFSSIAVYLEDAGKLILQFTVPVTSEGVVCEKHGDELRFVNQSAEGRHKVILSYRPLIIPRRLNQRGR